jgi:hypothetical protein
MPHRLQRLGAGADDQVAGQHGVGLLGVDAHLVQPLGAVGQAHEGQHGAALLREAHEVEHAGMVALEVRGHGNQRTDGDHPGAADAGDQQVVGAGPDLGRRPRQGGHLGQEGLSRAVQDARVAAQPAAAHRHEARAEALGAE